MDGIDYAYLWHFKDIGDTPAALSRLKETTNYLAGLYESVLPAAAVQPDQATSFYMLAGHLITLDAFCMILERNLEAVQ